MKNRISNHVSDEKLIDAIMLATFAEGKNPNRIITKARIYDVLCNDNPRGVDVPACFFSAGAPQTRASRLFSIDMAEIGKSLERLQDKKYLRHDDKTEQYPGYQITPAGKKQVDLEAILQQLADVVPQQSTRKKPQAPQPAAAIPNDSHVSGVRVRVRIPTEDTETLQLMALQALHLKQREDKAGGGHSNMVGIPTGRLLDVMTGHFRPNYTNGALFSAAANKEVVTATIGGKQYCCSHEDAGDILDGLVANGWVESHRYTNQRAYKDPIYGDLTLDTNTGYCQITAAGEKAFDRLSKKLGLEIPSPPEREVKAAGRR